MATPREVRAVVENYWSHKTPEAFAALKKMVSETTFTHQPLQVYGEDPWWDPDSFRDNVFGLTYDETSELLKVASFVDEARPDDRES